jgi:hypothetical protein
MKEKIVATQKEGTVVARNYFSSPSKFDGFANFRRTSEVKHEFSEINMFEKAFGHRKLTA